MNTTPIETRRSSVVTALSRFGVQPSFPPTDPTNLEEGADGDCVCPFAHLHTKPEPEGKPTVRIWLDRPDGNRPELGGKVMLSCRHMSCQDALWQGVTLPARKMCAPLPGTTAPPPDPKTLEAQKRKAQAALAGKEFLNQILNSAETLGATEAAIMDLSPFPICAKSGVERPPLTQLAVFLSLVDADELVYLGAVEDATSASHIRPRREWDKWIDEFHRSPLAAEEHAHWPWPGHYTTSSTFITPEGGRNNLNVKHRMFVVCESDKLGKKEQLRVIMAMIADPRFAVAYVLHSGGKSYHIGLRMPEPTEIDLAYLTGIPGSQAPKELIRTRRPERFAGMGFDPATVRLVQPVRVPGPTNLRTGRPQRLLYIDPSLGYESTPAPAEA